MAHLYKEGGQAGYQYRDQHFEGTDEDWDKIMSATTTLYVGNLSFYTTEEQIHELFSKCGEVKRIIMGLDRIQKTPCGFCFVEYYTREAAEACINWVNGTRLDDRTIRTDWDAGFKENRQYGRGKSGGQVRDEYRTDYDPGRGGYGKFKKELEKRELISPFLHPTVAYDPSQAANVANEPLIGRKRRFDDEADRAPEMQRQTTEDDASGPKNPRFREEDSEDEEQEEVENPAQSTE